MLSSDQLHKQLAFAEQSSRASVQTEEQNTTSVALTRNERKTQLRLQGQRNTIVRT